MHLTGNSILITGATRGIGHAFAARYIAEGASVAIADIHPAVAVFPASDEANYVVAQTYNVDGGQWMS